MSFITKSDSTYDISLVPLSMFTYILCETKQNNFIAIKKTGIHRKSSTPHLISNQV